MVDNKKDMVVKSEMKEILMKRGISIANLIKHGYDEKEMLSVCQYYKNLKNPYDSNNVDSTLENPTEVIVKNRNFLSDLIKRGFDEKEIPKIFQYYYGLCYYIGGSWGIAKLCNEALTGWLKAENFKEDTAEGIWKVLKCWGIDSFITKVVSGVVDKKFRKDVDYGIRRLADLCNNPVITNETKKKLAKERSDLLKIKKFFSWPPYVEQPIHLGEKDATLKAKSWKQMRGFQVVKTYNYIKPFMEKTNREMVRIFAYHKEYKDKDIFALICEFLNQPDNKLDVYTVDDIKNLYFNNIGYNSKI